MTKSYPVNPDDQLNRKVSIADISDFASNCQISVESHHYIITPENFISAFYSSLKISDM